MHFIRFGFYDQELLHICMSFFFIAFLQLPLRVSVNKGTFRQDRRIYLERISGPDLIAARAWRPIFTIGVSLFLSFLGTNLITPMCRLFVMLPLLTHLHLQRSKAICQSLRALLPRALLFLHLAAWCSHHLFSPSPVLILNPLLLAHCATLCERRLHGCHPF